ncbi:MAG: helix-turn-helix transcriptional regulator [Syntrophothermus sp.]|uniref:helix-turn-helix domain-containing protein n=1 Tax=Syntrophothermus sp. TaxID=2736299 RepID=UPI00257CBC6B|nr:helix-turn-helix transcriptional regulator [Syntrophothermus sp.]NSW83578.1 helix-turn-helix transcriptional regulator [Syntrophothermus sp.]
MLDIGTNLRYWRLQRRFTQEDLARMVGVERSTVANWERGSKQPSLENVVRLSQALGVSLEALVLGRQKLTDKPFVRCWSEDDPLVQELARRSGVPGRAIAAFITAMQASQEVGK